MKMKQTKGHRTIEELGGAKEGVEQIVKVSALDEVEQGEEVAEEPRTLHRTQVRLLQLTRPVLRGGEEEEEMRR